MDYVYEAQVWIHTTIQQTWSWFSTLSQQEWMVVLGIVTVFGFLCMRGFTHRGTL